jgi:glycosyltransferase involved in cell wall biosynthesis
MKSVLEEQATQLGIADRICIKPSIPTSEVPREIEQWNAHILPSITRPNWIEQFGRTLAEAMACEVPVIGSSSGEIPHVIGDAGLIFKEGDARGLSECIRKLMDDPILYEDMARRGRRRVLDNYTQEHIARRTCEIYREVLSLKLEL